MSTVEILVAVVGAGLGYLVVSAFMGGKPPPRQPGQADAAGAGAAPPPSASPAPPAPPPAGPAAADDDNAPWWRVLNLSPSASDNEIRTAYRSLISQYHPDKVASLGPELRALAEKKSKQITRAYQDAMLANGGTPDAP